MPAFDPSLIFLAIVLGMAFLVIRRGSRQRRELTEIQSQIAPGAEVMMASGIFGTVTSVDDEVLTLELAPGQISRWDRRAVAKIVTPGPASAAEPGTETKDEPA